MIWRPFIVALALPLVFVAMVFVDVQRNRGGERQPIALTEREVTLNTGTEENSGAIAWLTWTVDQAPGDRWLSRAQLAALGFDVSIDPASPSADRAYGSQLQRRAYVVLLLDDEQRSRSRLVPVDAGLDRDWLLAEYPDGHTHIVTTATVGIRRIVPPGHDPYEDGYLASIDPRGIHIPKAFRDQLLRNSQRTRAFTLLVRYGAELEPWVVDVQ